MTEQDWISLAGGLAGAILGLFLFFNYFKALSLRRLMADTPTSKVRSAPMGKVELKGMAKEGEKEIRAPFTESPCVWYRWKAEEERREHSNGKSSTRWVELASGESFEPFYLEDLTGKIKVDPSGAQVVAPQLFRERFGGLFGGRRSPFGGRKSPLGLAARVYLASPNRVRLSEWRLGIGLPVYVLGLHHSRRDESGTAENLVGADPKGHLEHALISYKSEEEMSRSQFWKASASLVFGIALLAGCSAYLAQHFGIVEKIKVNWSQAKPKQVQPKETPPDTHGAALEPSPEMIGY